MAAASIITSVVTGGTNSHQTVAEELNTYATDFVNQGVLGTITSGSPATGAFAVTQDASPDMGVTVLSGVAYVSGTPSGQDAQVLRARMTSNYTSYTINANSSGSTKYDWIYLQLSAANANTPSLAGDNVITLYTSRSTSNASDNGSPPTYGILLAVVTVANGASSITNANISDRRTQCSLSSVNSGNSTGWTSLGYALTYGANNGNKEFTVTTPNDLTGLLSKGMRLKVSRSVTPPTQSMAFVSASSQYATKASPSGITFTGAFTCEAWVYLNSYTGNAQGIVSRTDASTGGFALEINSSGQLRLFYGASSSFTDFVSYQSIPLGRWVHVAGVVTSVSSKTGAVYINGIAAPSTSNLTAATSLTQTSNVSVGGEGAGVANTFFNGYVSEARIWSTNQTQANIQANMAVSLVGTETNLVGLWQGNGAFTDATSNANNLTATNGAVATQASNPYNATEYAIITNVSYSNPTTTVTLFAGTDYTIPNQTLNTPYYSTSTAPFGFLPDKTKWLVDSLYFASLDAGAVTASTTVWLKAALSIPIGSWKAYYEGALRVATSNAVAKAIIDLNTNASGSPAVTQAKSQLQTYNYFAPTGPTAEDYMWTARVDGPVSLTTQTIYNLFGEPVTASTTGFGIRGDFAPFKIIAESAYV